jgi:hypothetical protein
VTLNPNKAEDPTVSWALVVLAVVTGVALIVVSVVPDIHDRAGIRSAIVTGAGGVLLLLGSYFAARTLRQSGADQRANRALKAIEMIRSEDEKISEAGRAVLSSLTTPAESSRRHPHQEVQQMIDETARIMDVG